MLRQEELEQAREEEKDRLAANDRDASEAGWTAAAGAVHPGDDQTVYQAESGRLLMERSSTSRASPRQQRILRQSRRRLQRLSSQSRILQGTRQLCAAKIETLTQEKEQKDKAHKAVLYDT